MASATFTACDNKVYTLDMPEATPIATINLGVSEELYLALDCDTVVPVTITPDDPMDATLLWKSSNTLVASVDNGVITAHSLGKANITVVPGIGFGKGELSRVIQVTVIPEVVKVTLVEFVNPDTEMYAGEKKQLTTKLYPVDHTYDHLYWTSSNPEVATVSETGLVSGLIPGEVDITATTHDGNTVSCTHHMTIKRSVPAEEVLITGPGADMYYKEVRQMQVIVTPDDAVLATLEWSSSDETVLTVDNDGVVTAKNFGTATITATCTATGNSSSIDLNVPAGFYWWSEVNAFEQWTVNNSIGKCKVQGGKLHCTVTTDANRRIYLQRCYSTGQNLMELSPVEYPIVAYAADAGLSGCNSQFNIANLGNTLSISPAMTRTFDAQGNVVYYYDLTAHQGLCNTEGLLPIRAWIFKILKSPVDEFDVHWIGMFKSVDELNAYIQ